MGVMLQLAPEPVIERNRKIGKRYVTYPANLCPFSTSG
jgi:hypothetical protein